MKNKNFWNELETCIENNKHNLEKMNAYNFLIRDSWDRQIVSYVLYSIEKLDLFFFCTKNEIESYETLFLNILDDLRNYYLTLKHI